MFPPGRLLLLGLVLPVTLPGKVQPRPLPPLEGPHPSSVVLVHVYLRVLLLVVVALVAALPLVTPVYYPLLVVPLRSGARLAGLLAFVVVSRRVPVLRHHGVTHLLPLHRQASLVSVRLLPRFVPLLFVPQLLQ